MPDIDVPAIIEAAAVAQYPSPRDPEVALGYYRAKVRRTLTAALPSIAEALYAPILALHPEQDEFGNEFCLTCIEASRCATRRTIEANLAAIRGQA